MQSHHTAACHCGRVQIETSGEPILTTACCCSDCRTAATALEQLPGAPAIMEPDTSTAMMLFRKDRVTINGQDMLRAHRLTPQSPTRRIVTSCCNSAVFLDFTKGHWLSIYRTRFSGTVPPIQMRVVTKELPPGVVLSEDVPNLATHNGAFIARMMLSWLKMGFRTPKLPDYPPLA